MINIELKTIGKQLGRSIVQIAKETGLHRNTITALYHNKAKGISFDTIEKICSTYSISISELMSIQRIQDVGHPERLYRQEGQVVPFTSWSWMSMFNNFPLKYFRNSGVGPIHAYFRNTQVAVYLSTDSMNSLAEWIWRTYNKKEDLDRLWKIYLLSADRIEQCYMTHDRSDIISFSYDALLQFVSVLRDMQKNFWGYSLFLDVFDAGVDRKQIDRIATLHTLSIEDIATLTSPEQLTFTQERLLALLELTSASFFSKKARKSFSKAMLEKWMQQNNEFQTFKKQYEYAGSSYAAAHHASDEEICKELSTYIDDPSLLEKDSAALKNHTRTVRNSIEKILQKKGLAYNPLSFFQSLTYWREHRKKINLMSIQIMYAVLDNLENVSGINGEYLKYLSMEEIEGVLKGLVTQSLLEERYNNGILIVADGKHYKIIEGQEAQAIYVDLEESVSVAASFSKLSGTTVYGGYAKGKARIIHTLSDALKIESGEIIVSPMTRPELIPFLKKACAIITDEGGITCHAAIIAREFHIPCIVGLGNATRLIKDGDLIEVRGHHGTVRILS